LRTISVKEAAVALGITPRAITYRLDKGQLKGTLGKNEFGVPEWRVYPNKEIMVGLNNLNQNGSGKSDALSFEPEDSEIVDAQSYTNSPPESDARPELRSWLSAERETIKTIAEEMVKPLIETINSQTVALIEKDRIIEDKDRQLRLLPDLQKQAEDERKTSELKAFEAEALKKQIEAMQSKQEETETAQSRVKELELAMEQLKTEKETKETVIQKQLEGLTEKLHQLQQPWWQKLFWASKKFS
jgi:hypothetical protein